MRREHSAIQIVTDTSNPNDNSGNQMTFEKTGVDRETTAALNLQIIEEEIKMERRGSQRGSRRGSIVSHNSGIFV